MKKGKKIDGLRLSDVLPVQESYYLLTDGTKFARFGGTTKETGLLVFPLLEKAEIFAMQVANRDKGKEEWKPSKVSALELLTLVDDIGAICLADGPKVAVCQIQRGPTE